MAQGWHGNPDGHAAAGKRGGDLISKKYGKDFFRRIGRLGGKASPTKFAYGDKRTVEAGRKGGSK